MLPCQQKTVTDEEKTAGGQPSSLLGMEQAVFDDHKQMLAADYARRVQGMVDRWEAGSEEVDALRRKRFHKLRLTTLLGPVTVRVRQGLDGRNRWVVPVLKFLGIRPNQRYSPDVEKRLAVLAAETGSYEKAAAVAGLTWFDCSDDAVRSLMGRLGQEAGQHPETKLVPAAAGPEDTLVIMADGWNARHRGKNWGRNKKDRHLPERVHWHEIRSAVIFKLSALLDVSGKRKAIMEKHVVATPAETSPFDFGAQLHREAERMGLRQAKAVVFVMDGGAWLWNIFNDRFQKYSEGMLDFYHLSQHLHILADALYGAGTPEAKDWCQKILHSLKHKSSKPLFKTLEQLLQDPPSEDPAVHKVIREQAAYCNNHADHMDYAANAALGIPIGSGSVESLCSQLQNRLKRTGQFWSKTGFASILLVIVMHWNGELDTLWQPLAA